MCTLEDLAWVASHAQPLPVTRPMQASACVEPLQAQGVVERLLMGTMEESAVIMKKLTIKDFSAIVVFIRRNRNPLNTYIVCSKICIAYTFLSLQPTPKPLRCDQLWRVAVEHQRSQTRKR